MTYTDFLLLDFGNGIARGLRAALAAFQIINGPSHELCGGQQDRSIRVISGANLTSCQTHTLFLEKAETALWQFCTSLCTKDHHYSR